MGSPFHTPFPHPAKPIGNWQRTRYTTSYGQRQDRDRMRWKHLQDSKHSGQYAMMYVPSQNFFSMSTALCIISFTVFAGNGYFNVRYRTAANWVWRPSSRWSTPSLRYLPLAPYTARITGYILTCCSKAFCTARHILLSVIAMLCQTSTTCFGKHSPGHRLGVLEAIACPPAHCVSRKKSY